MIRTKYMQELMNKTYHLVAIEAIGSGFKGSWERCIARQIEIDARMDKSEAIVILESVNNNSLDAAYLITSSKPKDNQ